MQILKHFLQQLSNEYLIQDTYFMNQTKGTALCEEMKSNIAAANMDNKTHYDRDFITLSTVSSTQKSGMMSQ